MLNTREDSIAIGSRAKISLKRFFEPCSVAIVGASRTKGKAGYEILASIIRGGYQGKIFSVNSNAETVQGLKSYPSLIAIGETPDLVVIVVPAPVVPRIMKECVEIHVKAVLIISSGFKEMGVEGAKLERSIVASAKSAGMRVIGPNCIGLMVPSRKLNVSFAGDLPKPGNIAYFSQSGSIMAAIVDMGNSAQMGFSKLISIGNKADMNELDILGALSDDAETTVIGGYLETIEDGDAFIHQAEKITRNKPILLIKSGITEIGAKAASSHTGRLLGGEAAYECVFERAGVIRCESISAQFDYARALVTQPLPNKGRVAVIANAGGAGIMAADAIDREGLALANFSENTKKRLHAELSSAASLNNPIDLLGDALSERYEKALRIVLEDPNVDVALVILGPHAMTECEATAEAVVAVSREQKSKPILTCFLGGDRIRKANRILWEGDIPEYESPERAVKTIRVMVTYARWRTRPKRVVKLFSVNRRKVEHIISRHLRQNRLELGEMDAKELLRAYGFVTPKGNVANTAEHATQIAKQIGYPVVLKVWSPDITHKAEVDGVKTNLESEQAVIDAFDLMMYRIPKKMPGVNIIGIYIEEMYKGEQEVILGMSRDQRFGPLMMFGIGGRRIETLEDIVFYPAPLTTEEAKEMLVRTRTYRVLQSGRDKQFMNMDAIAEGLQRLSQLATEFPQIGEVDINPYVVGPEGSVPVAVDAMMSIRDT